MAHGNIQNYIGGDQGGDIIEVGVDKFVKVYNDLGSAVTNGDVYFLDYKRDADSLTVPARPTLEAMATSAVYRTIAVVNNSPLGASTIADQAWGYVQVRGYCPDVKCVTATEAADNYIQGTNASQSATTDGTTQTTDSFGIMVEAAASSHGPAYLFGERVIIG